MHNPVIVYKGRTTVVPVNLGIDVSGDILTSEIRTGKDFSSDLIAAWVVTFATDGVDGKLILTMDDSVTGPIEHTNGYMDMKRVSNGEPLAVFEKPIEVVFRETVTA